MASPEIPTLFEEALAQLGIETRFHKLLAELTGGEIDYLRDVELGDIMGHCDANNFTIPAPVARGLLRKLQEMTPPASGNISATAATVAADATQSEAGTPDANTLGVCHVELRRGEGAYSSMMRCTVRGQVGQIQGAERRHKVLTAVLDNSGSMRHEWPLVVDAVSRVFTDDLLQDASVSLNAIAYNAVASEVKLPENARDLPGLLLQKFAPWGITNFQSAFELAEQIIRREVAKHVDAGVHARAIDVTTLLFTDGEDTSVPPHGCKSDAATAKARAAGDRFREFLSSLGCQAHTCIAAFGQQHSPEQCQYLSDRYFYINRKEVLSEWLTGGLAEMLKSGGHCSLQVHLPSGVTLAEPLPKSIALDENSHLDYEVWLQVATDSVDFSSVVVEVQDAGVVALRGCAAMDMAALVQIDCLEGHLFLLDSGELQLRQIALELRGNRVAAAQMARLRERLVGVVALVQPVAALAADVKAHLSGRGLLRARLAELEKRRMRLSYALGHFDEHDQDTRHVGAVGIDAILRDASQNVALGALAASCARRVEATAALPPPEELSAYGQRCTLDRASGCDARVVAQQGGALFFRLRNCSFEASGRLESAEDCGGEVVAFEAFMLLSQDGSKPAQVDADGEPFTHVGIPLYATATHFLRSKVLLREALGQLSPKHGYTRGVSERILLDLLGHALASHVHKGANTAEDISLLHKARSVSAVFEATTCPNGDLLMDKVVAEAACFVDKPEVRTTAENLFAILAVALFAPEWSARQRIDLGEAVIQEAKRRALAQKLVGASESERLKLAWAVLGPRQDAQEWLDEPLETTGGQKDGAENFNILTAGSELETMELTMPGEFAPRVAGLVSSIVGTSLPSGVPAACEWSTLRTLLSRWSALVEAEGQPEGVWKHLDELMLVGKETSQSEQLDRLSAVLHSARPLDKKVSLRDVLSDPMSILSSIASACLQELPEAKLSAALPQSVAPRLKLAATLRSVVARREALARKYPVTGKQYPCQHRVSAGRMQEIWGAAAAPVDAQLHDEVRQEIHRRHAELDLVMKETLSDKEYRRRGGHFAFPSTLDTFIPGLHRRTQDLYREMNKQGSTAGAEARSRAVEEMLLRLRWDDRDNKARCKLSKIVACIWDDLEGVPLHGQVLTSALWIDDGACSKNRKFEPPIRTSQSDDNESSLDSEDWKVV